MEGLYESSIPITILNTVFKSGIHSKIEKKRRKKKEREKKIISCYLEIVDQIVHSYGIF